MKVRLRHTLAILGLLALPALILPSTAKADSFFVSYNGLQVASGGHAYGYRPVYHGYQPSVVAYSPVVYAPPRYVYRQPVYYGHWKERHQHRGHHYRRDRDDHRGHRGHHGRGHHR